MPVTLLDVNVLLALAWPSHLHHAAAHHWFAENAEGGWSTCLLTQLSFARLSMQPAVVKAPMLFEDVMDVLQRMMENPRHTYWPIEMNLAGLDTEIRARIMGHQQLMDAVLVDLAIRHQGRLATFDRGILALCAKHDVVEVIPT